MASLTWETGVMDMGLRVDFEKIKLVLHIKSLDESTLAKKMYNEQKENDWPGLAKETSKLCEKLNVEDVNKTIMDKKQYIETVKNALEEKDKEIITTLAANKEKVNKIMKEPYGKKEYVKEKNIKEAREIFKTRVGLQPFAGNFSNDRRFARTEWLCFCLGAREEEHHLTGGQCPIYGDLVGMHGNLEDNDNLVGLFQAILRRR